MANLIDVVHARSYFVRQIVHRGKIAVESLVQLALNGTHDFFFQERFFSLMCNNIWASQVGVRVGRKGLLSGPWRELL